MEPQQALEHIRSQPKGRSSFKVLARNLGLRGPQRAALQIALDTLVSDGRIIEGRRGHYKIAGKTSGYLAGRFSQHPRGFGFVILDRKPAGVEGDIYIPRQSTHEAMHDDRVLVRLARSRGDGRVEGSIEQILERAQSLVVGEFQYDPRASWVIPHDDRVAGNIEVIAGKEVPDEKVLGERLGGVSQPRVETAEQLDGLIVTVALSEYPTPHRQARGRVIEVLGDQDDFGVDVEITIRKAHLSYRFPADALEEAAAIDEAIDQEEIDRRRDFRELPIVTIDGETARDFDDAVHVEKFAAGGFALQVHIADVSHFVQPGSALDREAKLRGTSVYFPDRAVPMLPGRLSTEICLLNPQSDRLTMSVLMRFSAKAELESAEFCRGVIRSARRMTYTEVFQILEGNAEVRAECGALCEGFETMRELAELLIHKRSKRGAVDLDLPEAQILFDEQGRMTGVQRSERTIAHRIIEEFMLAANEAVAGHLAAQGLEFLHRVHEKPSPRSVLEFEQTARSFGHSLGIDASWRSFSRSRRTRDGSKRRREVDAPKDVAVSSKDYQRLVEQIKGKPEERVLSNRLLRSLKQARYSEEAKGHFALATDEYLHFTSPIRRYPDLIVHRVLGAWLDRKEPSPYANEQAGAYTLEELVALADQTSALERRAAGAERELVNWKKAKFMGERLGEEFDGMVVSATDAGLWVELDELFIEGFVPIDSFADERYFYNERRRSLIGSKTKLEFALGDRVHLRLDRIAWDRLKPEFTCWKPKD